MSNISISPKKLKKSLLIFSISLLFFSFLYFLNKEKPAFEFINKTGVSYEQAQVVKINEESLIDSDGVGYRVGTQSVDVKLLSGSQKGEQFTATNYISYMGGVECKVGQTIIVNLSNSTSGVPNTVVNVYTAHRAPALYAFVAIFILVMCIIGGKKGAKSILALGFTFVCVIFMFVPLIFKGVSAIFAAVLVCAFTTIVTMYFVGGWSKKTLSSVIGTIAGVVIAAICALIASHFASISGYNISDAEDLVVIARGSSLRMEGLLFAGILISALGAVMDVAMSIASTIQEIHDKNPLLTQKELFTSGMNVGKDMMGTMSNTLILAFAGGALPTIIFIYAYSTSYQQFMNTYSIGIEIIQGIAGSMGVILTVPIVAFLSAYLLKVKTKQKQD